MVLKNYQLIYKIFATSCASAEFRTDQGENC